MQFNWVFAAMAVMLNLVFCRLIVEAQNKDEFSGKILPRGSVMRGGQAFLYWQDFYCQKYGCTIGLSLVSIGFLHLVYHFYCLAVLGVSSILLPAFYFIVIAFIDGGLFSLLCTRKSHKPDYGYPAIGQINTAGKLHAVYHGIHIAASIFLLFSIVIGDLRGPLMWMAIVGWIIYLITNFIDIAKGNFAPLKTLS